jgi:hypothetical protein
MAQPEMNEYPAAEAGAGPDHRDWGMLSIAQTGQPDTQSAASRSKRDRLRMLHAMSSMRVGAARPASPLAVMRGGASGRIRAILASWRATERELSELPEGSPDRPRLRAVVEGLRATHHRLFAERRDDSEES